LLLGSQRKNRFSAITRLLVLLKRGSRNYIVLQPLSVVECTVEVASMSTRIVTNPAILGGKPCIQGTRLSVEFILELIASGATQADIIRAYPQLTAADVEAAVRYAARSLKNDLQLTVEVPG
jgi:uncharacterized protein (DUF433 family)